LHRFVAAKFTPILVLAAALVFGMPLASQCAEMNAAAPGKVAADIPVTLKESVGHLMQIHDRIKASEATLKSSEHMEQRATGVWYLSLIPI